jgi:rubredoxin
MRKFKCSICGFTYDEAAGLPEKGIAPGTRWEDVPEGFCCPWCGAPKSVFVEVKEDVPVAAPVSEEEPSGDEHPEDLRELTAGELSALCSNLAKGCEKQRLAEEADLFLQLAAYYKGRVAAQGERGLEEAAKLLKTDLSETFARANAAASAKADRGALRALVWSEKVSRMMKSLLDRYSAEGDAMLEDTKIYVCDICGFIYIGKELPEICPVCKVPNFKMTQVGRR